jgi:hypothetical protein
MPVETDLVSMAWRKFDGGRRGQPAPRALVMKLNHLYDVGRQLWQALPAPFRGKVEASGQTA